MEGHGKRELPQRVATERRWLLGSLAATLLAAIALAASGPGPADAASAEGAAAGQRVQPPPGQSGRQPQAAEAGGPRARERTYEVRGNRLRGGRVSRAARSIWRRFKELVPRRERRHLRRFGVFSGGFAGAYVTPLRNPRKWKLAVWKGLRGSRGLDFTLIHEFGHLLTLRASQVPPGGPRGSSCPTYNPGEGCARPSSYLAQYVREYWQATGRLGEWRRADRRGNGALRRFFERHRSEFVTSYAASHPVEDMAESFAAWAVAPAPGGSSIAAEKRRWFSRFPELLRLRSAIQRADPDRRILLRAPG